MWRDLKVLLVDDDAQRRHDLKVILDFLGEPAVESECDGWRQNAEQHFSQGIICGAVLLGGGCEKLPLTDVLLKIREWDAACPVILLGDQYHLPDDADPYLKHMVVATLADLPTYNTLMDNLHRAQRYREAVETSRRSAAKRPAHLFRSLVGSSREITQVREMMSQVADRDVTVLITGESGTGKEVVARNLHYHSERRDKPFVPVNCGAIPAELLESELFGHEKGAFTGAISSRAGRFEMAEGGTLFLDEIGDMPLNMQVKILRVLQERCFERVGSNKSQPVDVRIIAATHRNLEQMIEEGSFREDLYYRLNVFPIEMPSLRERKEDIPLLLSELVSRLESENRGSVRFNSAAIMSLCQHEWSGNVRELVNLVERMTIMHPQGVIGVQDLPPKYKHGDIIEEEFEIEEEQVSHATMVSMNDTALLPEAGIDLKEYLTTLERNLIQQALDECGGIVARAATRLSIRRTTLVEKMRKYELQR
jgi:sigma-54 specific flagellar transcriptional regulator A